jgi:ATP/maltotriose-dependent transcriptional regulator MalT
VIARGGEALLERRPCQQLRHWSHQVEPLRARANPWAHVVAGVLAARDSHYDEALACLATAEAILISDAGSIGLYDVLSIREWAEFWAGDSKGSMATCRRALEQASGDAQRLHTLLSILSCAVDMRQWDAAEVAYRKAEALLPGAGPEERARAQALNAHAAYYRGDMRGALAHVRDSQSHGERAAQRASALNIRGMIETALGDFACARQHLDEATRIADQFGHTGMSYVIADSKACLYGATGDVGAAISALEALAIDAPSELEPSLRAFTLCHLGTALRRSGATERSLDPTKAATHLVSFERDPYVFANAAVNLAFTEGLLGADRQETLSSLSGLARQVGLRFVEYKAQLCAAVLLHMAGDDKESVKMLELCIPKQLVLGHVNLVAQELCARPELACALIRRNRSNGLGPDVLMTMRRSSRFEQAKAILAENGPSQVRTWIAHAEDDGHESRTSRAIHPQGRNSSTPNAPRNASRLAELTTRELEVLRLAADDLSNDEIGRELYISVPTVKTHMTHILRKLGHKSRVGAILEYQRQSREPGA